MKNKLLRQPLQAFLTGFLFFLITIFSYSSSHSQDAGILQNGDFAVTGFSGTTAPPADVPLPAGTSSLDETFINSDGVSLRVFARPEIATNAAVNNTAAKFEARSSDIGQVFGIALDDAEIPNIYVGATSAFGLQIVIPDADNDGRPERIKTGQPGAQWMAGQFGKQGGPGSIWRIDGITGTVTLFANVTSNGKANTGPGLGQLAFDPVHQQLLVSDLDTGLIHRFDMSGKDLGTFDHGLNGRPANNQQPVQHNPDNRLNIESSGFDAEAPNTWGYAEPSRQVWALAIHRGRLYYSVAQGGEIWSVGLAQDGAFSTDARFELALPKKSAKQPVSDIAFTTAGQMIIAQRGGIQSRYDYSRFHAPRNNAVLRFSIERPANPQTPGRWLAEPKEYAVGFGASQRNASGGIGLSCNGTMWTSGDALRDNPEYADRLSKGGQSLVHGLQGLNISQTKSTSTLPWKSMFIDFDGSFGDSNAAGHIGDVEVYQRCEGNSVEGKYVEGPPVYVPQDYPPISCPDSPYCPQNNVYPDLQITKIPAQRMCQLGKNCRFIIEVRNVGNVPFFGPLRIGDNSFGGKLTGFGPWPWSCGPELGRIGCWRPDVHLASGEATWLRIKVKVPKNFQRPVYQNCARIRWPWWKNGDANPANDGPSCAVVPIKLKPALQLSDLSIKKTAEKPICKIGQDCFFNIKVRNNGPDAFNGIPSFEDKVPAGLIYQGLGQMSQWQCQQAAGRISCTLPTGGVAVAPGNLGEVRLHFKVRPGFRGQTITNTALVHADAEIDSNPGNNSSPATVQIEADVANPAGDGFDLQLVKSPAAGETCTAGKRCHFNVKIVNWGPSTFTGDIQFIDRAPLGMNFIETVIAPGWRCKTIPPGTLITCKFANATLARQASTEAISIGYSAVKPGIYTNCAKLVNLPAGDKVAVNNEGCAKLEVVQDGQPDGVAGDFPLKVTKTARKSSCAFNQPCTFDIVIENTSSQSYSQTLNFSDYFLRLPENSTYLRVVLNTSQLNTPICTLQRSATVPSFYTCSQAVAFQPNEKKSFSITVTVPTDVGLKNGDKLYNKFGVSNPWQTGGGSSYGDASVVMGTTDDQDGGQLEKFPLEVTTKFEKSACFVGKPCTFRVIVKNNLSQPYSKNLGFANTLFHRRGISTNQNLAGTGFETNEPFCGADRRSTSSFFSCEKQFTFAANSQQQFYVTFTVPTNKGIKFGDKLHTNFLVSANGGDGAQGQASIRIAATDDILDGGPLPFDVKKTARSATCGLYKTCVFDIEFINNSNQPFSKQISILEHPRFTGQKSGEVGVPFTHNGGPFRCASSNRIPFHCPSTSISIAANSKVSFSMAVTFGHDTNVKVGDTVENCVEVRILDSNRAHRVCAPVTIVQGSDISGVYDLEVTKTATTQTCEIGKPCTIDAQIWNKQSRPFLLGANFRVADSVKIGGQGIASILTASNQTLCPVLDNGRFIFNCEKQLRMDGGQTLNYSLTVNIPGDPSLVGKKLTNTLSVSLLPNNFLNAWSGTASVEIIQQLRRPPAAANPPPPPPQLSLTKTGPAQVRAGQVADVQMVITNPGRFPTNSPYDLRERFLAGTIATTQIPSIAPAFGCSPALTGAPKDCSVTINLTAGQSRAHNFKIKVPDGLPTGYRGVSCTVLSPAGQNSSINVARIADQVSSGKFAPNGDGYACWQFTITGSEELAQNQQNLGQQPPPEESSLLCRNGMQLSQEGACRCPANRPWNGLYCGGTPSSQQLNEAPEVHVEIPPETRDPACRQGMIYTPGRGCNCPTNRPWNGLYCGGTPNSQQLNEAPEVHVEIPPETRDPACRQGMVYTQGRGCNCPTNRPWNGSYCGGTPPVGFTDDPGGSNIDDDKNTPHQAQFSPPNLSITKTLAQRTCKAGKKCTYQVRIKNSSFAPFSGPVEISDQISQRGARLISVSPRRWSCSGQSGRYTCRNPQVRLNAGAATQLQLTFALPTKARGQIKNCAAIVWRSTTQKRLRTIAVQQALGRLGYKVGGVDGAYGSTTARAISQYQRRNKLPTTRGINQKLLSQLFGRWGKGDGNSTDDRACNTTSLSRLPAVIACPKGFARINNRCVKTVRPPQCVQGQLLVNGRCVIRPVRCKTGTKWNGKLKRCVTPRPTCRSGSSYDPDVRRCVSICRKDQRWNGKRCITTTNCRSGTKFNPSRNRCVSICKRGQKWTGKQCVSTCRRGQKWNGNRCTSICRRGQKWTGKQCVSACRRGQKWNGRKCTSACRPGQKWNGRKCTAACRPGKKWSGSRCVNVCRSGQRWNGKRCIGRAPSGSIRQICTRGRFLDRKTNRCTCGRRAVWDPRRRRCRAL